MDYILKNNIHPAQTKASAHPIQLLNKNLTLNKSNLPHYALYNSKCGLIGHTFILVAKDKCDFKPKNEIVIPFEEEIFEPNLSILRKFLIITRQIKIKSKI